MKRLAVVAAGVIALGVGFWAQADWPEYRGTDNQGVAQISSAPQKLSSADLQEVWRKPLPEAFGEIAVVGDTAVVFGKRGDDELAVGLEAKTGNELWATRIDKTIKDGNGDGPRTTPCIDEGRVYVYGTYLKLCCLDLASGKPLWKHDIAAEFAGRLKAPGIGNWGNTASPLVVDNLVIVVGGGAGKGILAFDKKTGALAWAKTDEVLTHATPTVATILGQKQVICFMGSGLVSVEPASGRVLWRFAHPFKVSTAASPVVGGKNGDIVYCSAGYGIGAAACRISNAQGKWTATKLWRTENQNLSHWSTPVYYDGCIYGLFGHNDAKGPLACLDIETGQVKWSTPGFGSQGGMILLGDKLLIHTVAGDLVLVAASPDGCRELGRVSEFKGKDWIAPAFSDGLIYARTSTEGACFKGLSK